jgi:hypothetical protein
MTVCPFSKKTRSMLFALNDVITCSFVRCLRDGRAGPFFAATFFFPNFFFAMSRLSPHLILLY